MHSFFCALRYMLCLDA
ncbi:hypothetical protein Zm00014a_031726 [Zea mays]|uniref:Uncharacterized protein n=1 Tax=Zea mays TaxID=4577 RepID=A0A3L6DQF1_MAIZE|nr:hypothetical protein Zm00014a_031726 [Zea mays]